MMSKLFGYHFYRLLTEHFGTSYKLAPNQWGVQCGKPAVASLLTVVHAWFQALETGKETLTIYCDFWKAFGSVSHVPLLEILEATGLQHLILKWVQSYLTQWYRRGCWWSIVSYLSGAVWSTARLSAGTLAIPHLHKWCCQLSSGTYINLFDDMFSCIVDALILQRMLDTFSRTMIFKVLWFSLEGIPLEHAQIPWCHFIIRPLLDTTSWICLHPSKETLGYRYFYYNL